MRRAFAHSARVHEEASDAELIDAANAGDREALGVLYVRHRDWTVGLARRMVASDGDALDVLQDAFLYLFGKFPGLRLTCSLRSFLYPVVLHLAQRQRSRGRRTGELVAEPAAPPAAPAADGELAAALGSLSAEHRETVWLRFVDGLSLQEVADALSIPLGTVKSRLHVALQALREDPRAKKYFLA